MSRALLAGLAAFTLAACGDPPVEPPPGAEAGWLSVELVSPNSDDGGILFTYAGGRIDSVRVTGTLEIFPRQVSGSEWRVLLVGKPIAAGVIGAIFVPDVERAADYTATVLQVAANATYTQRNAAQYTLQVVAP